MSVCFQTRAWPIIHVGLFGGWGQGDRFLKLNSVSGNLQTIQMWNSILLVLILNGGEGESNLIESLRSSSLLF